MQKFIKIILFAFILVLGIQTSVSADASDAAVNIQNKCTRCHDSGVYTRADRKISSLAALGKQVRICNIMTEANWFDDEIDEVVEYLNSAYYKFAH